MNRDACATPAPIVESVTRSTSRAAAPRARGMPFTSFACWGFDCGRRDLIGHPVTQGCSENTVNVFNTSSTNSPLPRTRSSKASKPLAPVSFRCRFNPPPTSSSLLPNSTPSATKERYFSLAFLGFSSNSRRISSMTCPGRGVRPIRPAWPVHL